MTLGGVITSNIVDLLKRTQITSASPGWTNIVKDVIVSELGSDFDAELEAAIKEQIEELKVTNPEIFAGGTSTATTKIPKKKGFGEAQGISLASKTLRGAQDPEIIVTMGFLYLPHAALVAFAISLAPLIFYLLIKPGGPFDVRFKRIVDNEINAFLSRQTQKDTEFGVRQVIIQSKLGFTASNGVNNYNTVRGIREGGLNKERLERFGMVDQTKGSWPFG